MTQAKQMILSNTYTWTKKLVMFSLPLQGNIMKMSHSSDNINSQALFCSASFSLTSTAVDVEAIRGPITHFSSYSSYFCFIV